MYAIWSVYNIHVLHMTILYIEPVSPNVRLTCGQNVSVLEWEQSNLDPYHMFTEKYLTIECYNNYTHRVYAVSYTQFIIIL